MHFKRAQRGFTLIEVMIAVAIVGILASVAIPGYIRYSLRSKSAEAKLNLAAIKTSQFAFFANNDNFANVTTALPAAVPGAVKAVWPSNTCPAGCNRTNTTACTQFACINFQPSARVYYQYGVATRLAARPITAEFSAGALGDLDADSNRASFTYQSNNVVGGTLGILADPISACGAGRNANDIVDCTFGRY